MTAVSQKPWVAWKIGRPLPWMDSTLFLWFSISCSRFRIQRMSDGWMKEPWLCLGCQRMGEGGTPSFMLHREDNSCGHHRCHAQGVMSPKWKEELRTKWWKQNKTITNPCPQSPVWPGPALLISLTWHCQHPPRTLSPTHWCSFPFSVPSSFPPQGLSTALPGTHHHFFLWLTPSQPSNFSLNEASVDEVFRAPPLWPSLGQTHPHTHLVYFHVNLYFFYTVLIITYLLTLFLSMSISPIRLEASWV